MESSVNLCVDSASFNLCTLSLLIEVFYPVDFKSNQCKLIDSNI